MKCVLVGNYGVGNIGDEALKDYFLLQLSDVDWYVVSARPMETNQIPRLPLGLRSFFSGWQKTVSAIRHADALVFGGGSLFTDVESVWACVIWRAYAVVARMFGVPVILAFQGAGPWKTRLGRRLARKTYQQAAHVSVRDEESFARLSAFDLTQTPVLTFDPAFALFASHERRSVEGRLVIIPRANANEKFFAAVEKKLTQHYRDVRILLMQPDATERRAGERLRALTGGKADVIELTSVTQFLDEISSAHTVVTQRYHGALAALAMQIPVEIVPQAAGDKMDTLARAGNRTDEWLRAINTGAHALRDALGHV